MDYSSSGQGQVADAFEDGDKTVGFIIGGDFILVEQLLASQEGLYSTSVEHCLRPEFHSDAEVLQAQVIGGQYG